MAGGGPIRRGPGGSNMTRYAKTALLIFAASWAASCMAPQVGTIRTNVAGTSEIVQAPELKAFILQNPHPKIVLRVPNPPSNVTEADRFNAYINVIEKEFLVQGYTVRDRALLQTLVGGNADYKAIKERIDTDLIIDILALRFDGTVAVRQFRNKTTGAEESFATDQNYVECPVATLECRVTVVDKGLLGGLFTLKAAPSDFGEYTILVDGFRQNMAWSGKAPSQMFPMLRIVIDSEDSKLSLTRALAQRLIGLLTTPRG
jgi:hypothetical protein